MIAQPSQRGPADAADAVFDCNLKELLSAVDCLSILADDRVLLVADGAYVRVWLVDDVHAWRTTIDAAQAVGRLTVDCHRFLRAMRAVAAGQPDHTAERRIAIHKTNGGIAQLRVGDLVVTLPRPDARLLPMIGDGAPASRQLTSEARANVAMRVRHSDLTAGLHTCTTSLQALSAEPAGVFLEVGPTSLWLLPEFGGGVLRSAAVRIEALVDENQESPTAYVSLETCSDGLRTVDTADDVDLRFYKPETVAEPDPASAEPCSYGWHVVIDGPPPL